LDLITRGSVDWRRRRPKTVLVLLTDWWRASECAPWWALLGVLKVVHSRSHYYFFFFLTDVLTTTTWTGRRRPAGAVLSHGFPVRAGRQPGSRESSTHSSWPKHQLRTSYDFSPVTTTCSTEAFGRASTVVELKLYFTIATISILQSNLYATGCCQPGFMHPGRWLVADPTVLRPSGWNPSHTRTYATTCRSDAGGTQAGRLTQLRIEMNG
jgi:hypothetical protein